MYLEHFPEQFKVLPELGTLSYLHSSVRSHLTIYIGNILGIKEESRTGVIQALWNYIKIQGLQDKVDRRMVRADEQLRHVRRLIKT
jgi:SWI/SNF-related matrix-associated actin-dependent regulator of chromatin subfamily D